MYVCMYVLSTWTDRSAPRGAVARAKPDSILRKKKKKLIVITIVKLYMFDFASNMLYCSLHLIGPQK